MVYGDIRNPGLRAERVKLNCVTIFSLCLLWKIQLFNRNTCFPVGESLESPTQLLVSFFSCSKRQFSTQPQCWSDECWRPEGSRWLFFSFHWHLFLEIQQKCSFISFFLTIKKETQPHFCSYFSPRDTVVTTWTGKMTYSALAVIKTHHCAR